LTDERPGGTDISGFSDTRLEHIQKLLRDNTIPKLEGDLADDPLLNEIHDELKAIREVLFSFSAGDFSPAIKVRGIIPGCLKALQAHLRHLIWQVQMIEKGDFTQEVRFMGEFSSAFNSMVHQLNKTLSELKQKEETLLDLTNTLRNEVDRRNSAVEALQESEARFKYLASHDALTGAFSRRSFIEMAGVELENAMKSGIHCCMAIMDIDHFKLFNDTYGHVAGDEALRHVVRVVQDGLRKGDFLGRYGGEEFTIFFYGSDEQTGMAIAERLRSALASSPVKLETQNVTVTASFGITKAEMDPKEDGFIQVLVNNADIALYGAKHAGRNKVMLYTPGMDDFSEGSRYSAFENEKTPVAEVADRGSPEAPAGEELQKEGAL
jgi:diguanylate cyclase (GGDEF)-like protein